MSQNSPEAGSSRYESESDRVRQFFVRPFFLSLTIGIPFCTYKILFGIAAVRAGAHVNTLLTIFGWLVIAWAATDLCMNAARAGMDLASLPASFEYCTIAQAGRILQMPMAFLALDTFLSFSIICSMLWSGWVGTLTASESALWSAATTLNLISLSLVSLYHEVRKAKDPGPGGRRQYRV